MTVDGPRALMEPPSTLGDAQHTIEQGPEQSALTSKLALTPEQPCLEQAAGPDGFQRSLPTTVIL